MNILIIHELCGFWGGVEQNIKLAVTGLKKKGHRLSLYALTASGRDPDRFTALFDGRVYLASENQRLKEVIEQGSFDVLYVHKYTDAKEILQASGGVPIVRMVHDHDLYCPRRHKYYSFNRHVCKRPAGLFCYADLAFLERSAEGKLRYTSIQKKLRQMKASKAFSAQIVASRFMAEQMRINGFDQERVHILPPAVTFGDIKSSQAKKTGHILFVGQLIRGKGVDLLLEALQRCPEHIMLDVVGVGNDEQYLRQRAIDLHITERVIFHGWVDHEELTECYDTAMFCIVPSRWPEPFGMVGLEAMLRERAVIAFEVGGIPDWLVDGNSGLLVPEADVESLAQAIIKLDEDIELARSFGRFGKEYVSKQFDFESYISDLEKVLEGKG